MFDGLMSPFHWMVILVVVLVVLGPKEGVKAAGAVGRTLEQLRRLSREPMEELLAHVSDREPGNEEVSNPPAEGNDDTSVGRDSRT